MSKIDVLKQYLIESPEDPFLHYALAKEFEKHGDYALALSKYRFLQEQHASYVGTYYHLGKLLEQLGETVDAAAAYRSGIAVATDQGDAHSRTELESALSNLVQ